MISSVNVTKSADLVTFTDEILNVKLHFCAVSVRATGLDQGEVWLQILFPLNYHN